MLFTVKEMTEDYKVIRTTIEEVLSFEYSGSNKSLISLVYLKDPENEVTIDMSGNKCTLTDFGQKIFEVDP